MQVSVECAPKEDDGAEEESVVVPLATRARGMPPTVHARVT